MRAALASVCIACQLPLAALGCEAALVLAMDVSGSVDPSEYRLQVDGLVAALHDPELQDVLIEGQIALAVTQWSALDQAQQMIGWRQIRGAQDLGALRAEIAPMPRAFAGGDTSIGTGLAHAVSLFAQMGHCARKIVDLSGDGPENSGDRLAPARAEALRQGVEINGLAIESFGVSTSNFYRARVISPKGFVETARGHLDYARAIRAKLLRELRKIES